MGKFIALLLGMNIVLVATAPVAGQTVAQTPEGAVRFLVTALIGTENVRPHWNFSHKYIYNAVSPTADVCRLKANVTTKLTTYSETNDNEINFSNLIEVRQEGSSILWTDKDPYHTRKWDLRAENLSARVAYAMDFLRQHCDKSADTGF